MASSLTTLKAAWKASGRYARLGVACVQYRVSRARRCILEQNRRVEHISDVRTSRFSRCMQFSERGLLLLSATSLSAYDNTPWSAFVLSDLA